MNDETLEQKVDQETENTTEAVEVAEIDKGFIERRWRGVQMVHS